MSFLYSGTGESHERSDIPMSGDVYSVSLWFLPIQSNHAAEVLWSLHDGLGLGLDMLLIGDSNDTLNMYRTDDGDTSQAWAATGNDLVEDEWNHVIASTNGDASRSIILNGGTPATDTENYPQASGLDTEEIGAVISGVSGEFDGVIADVAVWDVVLTQAEATQLNLGVSPLLVRPQNLVSYRPMVRDTRDVVRGNTLTANGSPTVSQQQPHLGIEAQTLQFSPAAGDTTPPSVVFGAFGA